jgi:tetratricopeptide (TPR) repeat protein
MRPDLNAIASRTNLTEEDFQAVLAERELFLSQGDELGYANCLLTLSHVVKWVRSDNGEMPFMRARTLALEALPIMRRLADGKGTIWALLQAVPFSPPVEIQAMFEEAMSIAREMGDERERARVLNRMAANLGLSDKEKALALQLQSLEIYERLGNVGGQATCLFSLAVLEKDDGIAYEYAKRSAELSRSSGSFDEAARATSLALMYWPDGGDLSEKRALAENGLKDAQEAGKRSLEGGYYRHLAEISAQQGNFDEAEQFRRWEKDIEEADGLTPDERKQNELDFTKQMAKLAKSMGNKGAASMFGSRARELKKSKTAT